ncbi:GFA family protein [uncultured Sulfitobacter sp.]|uniref:GFA family protein n=1 Tax=uncultured Sulfitobacter sp. TaxID=191468 RepID=UPI0030D7C100
MLQGSCLCGAITFQADAPARDPAACHCTQCRKQSGHYWAAVQVLDDGLKISGSPKWYTSSPGVRRGFCQTCGSFLFWKSDADPDTGVSLGAVDGPTRLHLTRHIFVADKGDYYDIIDGVPQEEQEDG